MCANCGSTNVNGVFIEYDLGSFLKDALEHRKLVSLIEDHKRNRNNDPNYICDINDGIKFKEIEQSVLRKEHDIFLLWNTNGLPAANN